MREKLKRKVEIKSHSCSEQSNISLFVWNITYLSSNISLFVWNITLLSVIISIYELFSKLAKLENFIMKDLSGSFPYFSLMQVGGNN